MKSGKLSCGFEFEFDENNVDDMRFLEKLSKMDDNPLLIPEIAEQLLGVEQKEALYKYLEDENGKVPTSEFGKALKEIFEVSSQDDEELKNS